MLKKRFLVLAILSTFAVMGCKKSVVNPLTPKENIELAATVAVTNSVVAATSGANTVTITFNQQVKSLSLTNANDEISISGCSVNPSVAISTAVMSDHSVATATLSGGVCADTNTVSIQVQLDKVRDAENRPGTAAKNPAVITYTIDMTLPIASLSTTTYPVGHSAITSSTVATLSLGLTNAVSTTLLDSAGSSSSAPAGLTVTESGTATCSNIQIQNSSLTSADIEISGCTGDGRIEIQVDADIATGARGLKNVASGFRTILVQNTSPMAVVTVNHEVVGSLEGQNTVVATFDGLVKDLSAINGNGEFVVTGCTTVPDVIISMATVLGKSVATALLTGGVCADGDTVTVSLQLGKIEDLAGNTGSNTGHVDVTYDIDTTLPAVGLGSIVYPPSQGAVKLGDSAVTVPFIFTNADTSSLVNGTGNSMAPPSGIEVDMGIGVSCAVVEVRNQSLSSVDVSLEGCLEDGYIDINVKANVLTSQAGLQNIASSVARVWVQNSKPLVTMTGLHASGGAAGENSFVAAFSSLIPHPAADGSGGEITVTGCTGTSGVQPAITIVATDDNNTGKTTLAVDLGSGDCLSTDMVQVEVHMDLISDAAGNVGDAVDNQSGTYTIP